MFFKILFMATFLIIWLRKYDQNQDSNGDEENSFSKNQPDKVFFFGILISAKFKIKIITISLGFESCLV
jgi:hypothetical protein